MKAWRGGRAPPGARAAGVLQRLFEENKLREGARETPADDDWIEQQPATPPTP